MTLHNKFDYLHTSTHSEHEHESHVWIHICEYTGKHNAHVNTLLFLTPSHTTSHKFFPELLSNLSFFFFDTSSVSDLCRTINFHNQLFQNHRTCGLKCMVFSRAITYLYIQYFNSRMKTVQKDTKLTFVQNKRCSQRKLKRINEKFIDNNLMESYNLKKI